tara:strand:+ start:4433 stop:4834 length:402 start_codon:yes stop_codon:yes gene_type:complete
MNDDTHSFDDQLRMPGLTVHTRGFRIQFENGYGVSVCFGAMNYCQNRNGVPLYEPKLGQLTSSNAEILVYDIITDENILTHFGGSEVEQVIGWQSPEDVTKILDWAAKQPPRASMVSRRSCIPSTINEESDNG